VHRLPAQIHRFHLYAHQLPADTLGGVKRIYAGSRHLVAFTRLASHTSRMADTEIQKGDKVSWNWGSGKPSGEVAEVKEQGDIAIESNRGNIIKKKAEPENPVVHIERPGNDVVKRASELTIEEKSSGANGQSNGDIKGEEKDDKGDSDNKSDSDKGDEDPEKSDKKDDVEMKGTPSAEEDKDGAKINSESKDGSKEDNKDDDSKGEQEVGKPAAKSADKKAGSKAGSKRKADEPSAEDANGDPKKTKANDANTDAEDNKPKPKKVGRPPKSDKKEPAKKKEPKKAATADGQPRRSGRNKS